MKQFRDAARPEAAPGMVQMKKTWEPAAIGAALAAACVLAASAGAQQAGEVRFHQGARRDWGPEQATGPADTQQAGDIVTAWASLRPDGGAEWLLVEFERAVPIATVRIRETYNPGAVSKVSAFVDGGEEVLLWQGQDPTSTAPAYFVVEPAVEVTSKRVKIHLETTRVTGWNEIDAVELIGGDGTRQWASRAAASSTYAEQPRVRVPQAVQRDAFSGFLQQRITVYLDVGEALKGVLLRSSEGFIVVRAAAGDTVCLVNKDKIVYAEIADR